MYDLKEVSAAELMGESLPISCSGSLILKLNTGSLESWTEGCCSAQGLLAVETLPPQPACCHSDSYGTLPQGCLGLLIPHSFSVTLKDVSFTVFPELLRFPSG